ncbi:hypothetical protein DCAR_0833004 [Daucus carota subsp. sativus]|uniref:SP-RING-type domain-containing protein n=1 Tax=Daucus carota subsp. sativus TaxID=79200 RepID=A0AAF0XVB8_DAUCS|nr:hypothetical protein DCAR_0833004 [Daucus carota subsp. sativus]
MGAIIILAELGVKELQYVLSMLGLEYHGSERDLRARILDTLVSEQVLLYHSTSNNSMLKKIACFSLYFLSCENPHCRVLQHKTCALGLGPAPPHYYCQVCRINRADPYYLLIMVNPLHIQKFTNQNKLNTSNLALSIVRQDVNFSSKLEMVAEVMYLINHKGYEVQACCIFLDDVDQFRMRWPSNSKIKVNGNDVKTEGRLGPGGLRDGVLISTYLDEGSNDISFTASPNGIFRLGIRLVKPRTIQEVCSIICNKQDGELLNDATARVIRCVTGGAATLDAAQRELEVLADSAAVDLRCPISGGRMKIASRFRSCIHMACFDLESFLGLAKTTKKIEQSGADTAEIKIRADGSWFPSNEASTSRTNSITCDDLSSPQRTPTNHGASLDDPLILKIPSI